MADDKQYWLDKPGSVNKVTRTIYTVCALLFLGDLAYHKHPYFAVEEWLGFYGIYGFVACVLLVLGAKELRKVLIRDEDYYER